MKRALSAVLGIWFACTIALLVVWVSAVGQGIHWLPDQGLWTAVWCYHFGLLAVVGIVSTIAWLFQDWEI